MALPGFPRCLVSLSVPTGPSARADPNTGPRHRGERGHGVFPSGAASRPQSGAGWALARAQTDQGLSPGASAF